MAASDLLEYTAITGATKDHLFSIDPQTNERTKKISYTWVSGFYGVTMDNPLKIDISRDTSEEKELKEIWLSHYKEQFVNEIYGKEREYAKKIFDTYLPEDVKQNIYKYFVRGNKT